MKFNTPYQRTKDTPEINSGEKLVETAGYIPAQKRIENLMLAGLRLMEYRANQFDFGDKQTDIDYDFWDPTRSKNFDLADVSRIKREIKERHEIKLKELKEAELKASQTAQKPPEEAKNIKEG